VAANKPAAATFTGRRAAVVLGASVGADGTPSDSLRRRALHAAALWHGGQVDLIVASGGAGRKARPGTPSEAAVIARLCQQAGVAHGALRTEDKAQTTRQNIRFALPLLRNEGAQTVVLVTDPYHAPRAWLMARQAGLFARVSCPGLREVPLRQWLRHLPREGAALLATLLRVI